MKNPTTARTKHRAPDRICVPSVNARLKEAMQTLVLAEGALIAAASDCRPRDAQDYSEAATVAIGLVYEELYWLTHLGPDILGAGSPDYDQAEAIKAGAEATVIGGER